MFRCASIVPKTATLATANLWVKAFEMRIHYGPGYRVYFVQRGMEIVILLAGGNKSTQAKDIKTALEIARQL